MHITLLTSTYPRFSGDGAAPFVQSIAEGLAKLGHQIDVIAPDDILVAPYENSAPITVHRFRYFWPRRWQIMGHARALAGDTRLRPATYLQLPFFLLAELITLLRVTKIQNSDFIYVHWVLPNGPAAALAARIRRIPLAISLHGSDIYVANKRRIFGAVARWSFRQARCVTACSPELRDAARKLGAPDETRLMAWGVDPERFHPQAVRADLRSKFNLPAETQIIAALGRLVPKKGFDILLRAWALLAPEFPSARLLIGGEGEQHKYLVALTEELNIQDKVVFAGQIPWHKTPSFLTQADIFVLPSRQDCFGNRDGLPTVLLEAMS
ncbi:MAG: glycosyltransferase, partial [Chloroflexi bacterium]|nr:glycosyltransferase [Chloroflexota bacterium]